MSSNKSIAEIEAEIKLAQLQIQLEQLRQSQDSQVASIPEPPNPTFVQALSINKERARKLVPLTRNLSGKQPDITDRVQGNNTTIPGQTTPGKELANPLMVGPLPKRDYEPLYFHSSVTSSLIYVSCVHGCCCLNPTTHYYASS